MNKTHDMACGTCGRTWSSVDTPTPAARCPYEAEHDEPSTIRVRATVEYTYDLSEPEPVVSNEEEALEDVRSMIDNREISTGEFTIEVVR